MKNILLAIFCVLTIGFGVFAQSQNSSAKVETIKVANEYIKNPVKLIEVGIYRDGGTIYATIEDASGKNITFCIDGIGGDEYRNIYLGIKNPHEYLKNPDAIKLDIAGNDEKALLKVMQNWKKLSVSKEQKIKISAVLKLNMEEMIKAQKKLSEDDFKLLRIFSLIDVVQRRNLNNSKK